MISWGILGISLMMNCVTGVLFICHPHPQLSPQPPIPHPVFSHLTPPQPLHFLAPTSVTWTHPPLLPPFLMMVGAEMIRTQFALTTKSLLNFYCNINTEKYSKAITVILCEGWDWEGEGKKGWAREGRGGEEGY